MAKRETRVKTKTLTINFFFIEYPSFGVNLSIFTFIDGGSGEFIQGGGNNRLLEQRTTGMLEEWRNEYSEEGEGDENGSFSMFGPTDGNNPSRSKSHLSIKNVRPFALDLHSNLSSLPLLPDQRKF
jgi:hypothetical protein